MFSSHDTHPVMLTENVSVYDYGPSSGKMIGAKAQLSLQCYTI